jgi:hypothetical protein
MLRIPSFCCIGDLTVYQEVAASTRFYLMPWIGSPMSASLQRRGDTQLFIAAPRCRSACSR